ncbi:MAG: DUF6682 family protein [Silanimonas sp.]
MTLAELIAEARIRLDDAGGKQLWSDLELTSYINEAQREACERALLLESLKQLRVTAGRALYTLPGTIQIKQVTPHGRPALEPADETKLDIVAPRWREELSGSPRWFVFRDEKLRIVAAPSADATMTVQHYRLPEDVMASPDDEPEIAERHHLRMLDWALHRAYLKRDADANSPELAARHEAAFTASFGVKMDANVQRKQREHRTHTVQHRY